MEQSALAYWYDPATEQGPPTQSRGGCASVPLTRNATDTKYRAFTLNIRRDERLFHWVQGGLPVADGHKTSLTRNRPKTNVFGHPYEPPRNPYKSRGSREETLEGFLARWAGQNRARIFIFRGACWRTNRGVDAEWMLPSGG